MSACRRKQNLLRNICEKPMCTNCRHLFSIFLKNDSLSRTFNLISSTGFWGPPTGLTHSLRAVGMLGSVLLDSSLARFKGRDFGFIGI